MGEILLALRPGLEFSQGHVLLLLVALLTPYNRLLQHLVDEELRNVSLRILRVVQDQLGTNVDSLLATHLIPHTVATNDQETILHVLVLGVVRGVDNVRFCLVRLALRFHAGARHHLPLCVGVVERRRSLVFHLAVTNAAGEGADLLHAPVVVVLRHLDHARRVLRVRVLDPLALVIIRSSVILGHRDRPDLLLAEHTDHSTAVTEVRDTNRLRLQVNVRTNSAGAREQSRRIGAGVRQVLTVGGDVAVRKCVLHARAASVPDSLLEVLVDPSLRELRARGTAVSCNGYAKCARSDGCW